MNELRKLSNGGLVCAYNKAKKLDLDPHFIYQLEEELKRSSSSKQKRRKSSWQE